MKGEGYTSQVKTNISLVANRSVADNIQNENVIPNDYRVTEWQTAGLLELLFASICIQGTGCP